jgi:predicted HicB family RNase H-like nuclease
MAPNNYILNGERVSADKYNKAKYEDLRVRVPRGKKEIIQSHAQAQGKSVNGFINEAIDEKMQRDIKKGAE